jgi:hypothetical protein
MKAWALARQLGFPETMTLPDAVWDECHRELVENPIAVMLFTRPGAPRYSFLLRDTLVLRENQPSTS